MKQRYSRRTFLKKSIVPVAALSFWRLPGYSAPARSDEEAKIAYLKLMQPTREDVDRFLSKEVFPDYERNNKGWTYHPRLGWVLKDGSREDGINGSKTFYHYEKKGCRRALRFSPDQKARIQTFGNSMAHCDQVSDYETWQNYLAAHLQEPVENYGIGGYSVYQAYLRYREVQEREPGECIILDLHPDDHFRNLDPWRSIRFGRKIPDGFTLPHLEVDSEKGACVERENLCPSEKDVYKLADLEFLEETFLNHPVFDTVMKTRGLTVLEKNEIPVATGLPLANLDTEEKKRVTARHEKDALFATKNVLEWFERDTKARGQKFFLVVSSSLSAALNLIRGEPNWDDSFLEFGKAKDYPFVDMREAHARNLESWGPDRNAYRLKYFNGHYAPAGNYFVAETIRDQLVELLDPRPAPYR